MCRVDTCRPFEILARYFPLDSNGYRVIVAHSVLVAHEALEIARRYVEIHPDTKIDFAFIEEASLLHDIGVCRTNATSIGGSGEAPYICHGVLGREVLDAEGWPLHALVCERHTGSGITKEDVLRQQLPLPERDYLPKTLEEKIICVADKFFGKKPSRLWVKGSVDRIERQLGRFGDGPLQRWEELKREFLCCD